MSTLVDSAAHKPSYEQRPAATLRRAPPVRRPDRPGRRGARPIAPAVATREVREVGSDQTLIIRWSRCPALGVPSTMEVAGLV